MKKITVFLLVSVLVLGLSAIAGAAVVVTLDDETQSTTFTATVAQQASVSVPATVAFSVGNVAIATDSSAQSVTVTQIVLTNGNGIKIFIAADADSFTKPGGFGAVTWASTDVSWVATWSAGGVANNDALGAADVYIEVAQSLANPASLSSSDLVFTLAAKATVDRAGDHELTATWKFESFTPGP